MLVDLVRRETGCGILFLECRETAGITEEKHAPLFRTLERKKGRPLSDKALAQAEAYLILKRRAKKVGIIVDINGA